MNKLEHQKFLVLFNKNVYNSKQDNKQDNKQDKLKFSEEKSII